MSNNDNDIEINRRDLIKIFKSLISTDIIYFNSDLFILLYKDLTEIEAQLSKKENLAVDSDQHLFHLKSITGGYVSTVLKSSLELMTEILQTPDISKKITIDKERLRFEYVKNLQEKIKEFPALGIDRRKSNALKVLTKVELKNNIKEQLFLKPEFTNFIFTQSLFKRAESNLYSRYDLDISEDVFYILYLDSMKDKLSLPEHTIPFYLLEPIAIIRLKNQLNNNNN